MEDGAVPLSVFQWVVSGMFALLGSVGGFFFRQINTRLKDIEKDLAGRNERLAVVEAKFSDLDRRLDRIEMKLDVLIDTKGCPKKGGV